MEYPNLWDGIDLRYTGARSQLKYTFYIKPGADPGKILFAYHEADSLSLTDAGGLTVSTPAGNLHDGAPVAWQEIEGTRRDVPVRFALDAGTHTVSFRLGDYDPSYPLILDPAVFVYAGYIGGSGDDWGYGIAVDGSGNAYVTGETYSTEATFPVAVGQDITYNGDYDAFVAKISVQYTLTVNKAGTGTGTVTSDPAGIDCGSTCNADFVDGTVVTLTATPDAGSTFTGWSGDCDLNGQVTMDANKECIAAFNVSPPASPSSLTARAISSTSIVLGWKDNSTNEKGFKVLRKLGACDSTNTWLTIATKWANAVSHRVSGLDAGTTYSFRIRAYNAGGSTYTGCVSATTGATGTPESPTNFKAVSTSSNNVKLIWTDNSADETSFKIYRKVDAGTFTLLTTTAADTVTYSDTTATGNTSTTVYSYYIKACNASGCSPQSTTAIVPYRPLTLSTSPVSSTQINLSWTDASINETGFKVHRKEGSCSSTNTWSLLSTKEANATSHSDTGLTTGTTYSYRVRAYAQSRARPYSNGYSMWSNCSEATTTP